MGEIAVKHYGSAIVIANLCFNQWSVWKCNPRDYIGHDLPLSGTGTALSFGPPWQIEAESDTAVLFQ